ncbi:MAG TPA: hypothetical protein VFE50_13935 [Cyclobacteriaceae bacterium]|nr:hypothetical protein [Cyclobacteriaceae bacterium]
MGERKFKLSILEYSKVILSKISFDRKLFRKEYKKAFRKLDNNDRTALKSWIRASLNI